MAVEKVDPVRAIRSIENAKEHVSLTKHALMEVILVLSEKFP